MYKLHVNGVQLVIYMYLLKCCCVVSVMNVISSYLIEVSDPGIKKSPSWEVTPDLAETAIEGRNKTLYCFAVGR